jgi:hypothetical protein
MAIISNFKNDTLWKAFILNSLTSTVTIYIAIILKEYLDKINTDKNINDWFNSIIIVVTTFCTSMFSYIIMFFLFGFGTSLVSK